MPKINRKNRKPIDHSDRIISPRSTPETDSRTGTLARSSSPIKPSTLKASPVRPAYPKPINMPQSDRLIPTDVVTLYGPFRSGYRSGSIPGANPTKQEKTKTRESEYHRAVNAYRNNRLAFAGLIEACVRYTGRIRGQVLAESIREECGRTPQPKYVLPPVSSSRPYAHLIGKIEPGIVQLGTSGDIPDHLRGIIVR